MLTNVYFITVGWTVKSKTTFNKISPVTILGHSYLLNSEGTVFPVKFCLFLLFELSSSFVFFALIFSTLSLPFRRSGAVSFGLRVEDLVDLQERVPTAGGLHLDYRLWLGLYAAQRADAAGAGSPRPFDAHRFVLLLVSFEMCLC